MPTINTAKYPLTIFLFTSSLALTACSSGGNESQPTPDTPTQQPPVATITAPDEMTERSEVTVSAAQSTDPDGTPLSYVWSINSSPDGAATLSDSQAVTATITVAEIATDATLELVLTVTDASGQTASTSSSIFVDELDFDLLPPDPGAAGKLGLLGVDVDGDGVRDDMAHAIYERYPLEAEKREILSVAATAMQGQLQAVTEFPNDDQAVVRAQREAMKAMACLYYGDFESSQFELGWLESLMGNTPERAASFNEYRIHLGGTITEVPQITPSDCQHNTLS